VNPKVQKLVAALAGRLGERTDLDDARGELADCRELLAAAQAELARLRTDLAVARQAHDREAERANRLARQLKSEQQEVEHLARLTGPREAPAGLRGPLGAPHATDRSNLARLDERVRELEERVDELLAENEQLLKELAG
jgi:DNA repair exonuclease SbcCD ATPase subunit